MFDLCSRVLFWTFVYLGAARLGGWVTRSDLRGVAHLAWDGLAGLPMLIAACLAVGLLRFDRLSMGVVLAVFLATAAIRAVRDPLRRFRGVPTSPAARASLALVALVAAAGLLWNRVPVLFYDSLAYHFAQPEAWIFDARIAPYPWSLHSWFPPGMSVLYGLGLLFGGEPWANDANVMIGVALLLVGFDLARRLWDDTAGVVVIVALLAVPQVLYALAIPAADLAHGTFVAASLGALLLARDGNPAWTRRAAWTAAGAVQTKYLGFLVPWFVGCLAAALARPAGTAVRKRFAAALLFALPAVILVGPWLGANGAVVGNPVAPVASSLLPVDGLAPGGAAAFTRDARGGLPDASALAALSPRLFAGTDSGIYPSPAWGWAFAVWAALAVAGAFRDASIRQALAVAGFLFLLWLVTYRWERFLIAVAFFACLALAGTLASWFRTSRAATLAAVAVLLFGWAAVPGYAARIVRFSGGVDVFLGRETPEGLLARSWPQGRLLATLEFHETDRLLLVGEMRHFRVPLSRAAPSGFNLHPLVEELARAVAADQVHERLRRRGYTHLLVDLDQLARSSRQYPSLAALADEPSKFDAYLASLGPPLASDGPRSLYALPGPP